MEQNISNFCRTQWLEISNLKDGTNVAVRCEFFFAVLNSVFGFTVSHGEEYCTFTYQSSEYLHDLIIEMFLNKKV